jgi:Methionine synthase I (cobalamin-dependent), methyltransferase domain
LTAADFWSKIEYLPSGEAMTIRDENILFFDGACGTNLQRMEIPPSAWEGRDGCNEFLNVSAPEVIREWHSSFLSAGATVLETNTFGANTIVLAEYGLADRVEEINRAAVKLAREVEIGRAVQQECRDRYRMPSSA